MPPRTSTCDAQPPVRGPRNSSPAGNAARHAGAWLAALAMHALALWGAPQLQASTPAKADGPRPAMLTLSPQSMQVALQQARRERKAAEQRAAAPKPRPLPQTAAGPVLNLPPTADKRAPRDPKFAAEQDHFAQDETRSRHAQLRPNAIAPEQQRRAAPQASAQDEPQPAGQVTGAAHDSDGAPQVAAKRQRPQLTPKHAAEQALALKQAAALGLLKNQPGHKAELGAGLRLQQGEPGAREAAPAVGGPRRGITLEDLIPSVGALARMDAAPMSDVVDDNIAEGEGTFLNARAFKYASFYNRLKERLAVRWHAMEVLQRRDPTGEIYGRQTRTTEVRATLASDGSLIDVRLQSSCGIAALDEAGMQAFRQAQPFTNPPRGLLEADGRLHIDFTFAVRRDGDGPMDLGDYP